MCHQCHQHLYTHKRESLSAYILNGIACDRSLESAVTLVTLVTLTPPKTSSSARKRPHAAVFLSSPPEAHAVVGIEICPGCLARFKRGIAHCPRCGLAREARKQYRARRRRRATLPWTLLDVCRRDSWTVGPDVTLQYQRITVASPPETAAEGPGEPADDEPQPLIPEELPFRERIRGRAFDVPRRRRPDTCRGDRLPRRPHPASRLQTRSRAILGALGAAKAITKSYDLNLHHHMSSSGGPRGKGSAVPASLRGRLCAPVTVFETLAARRVRFLFAAAQRLDALERTP